MGNRTKLLATVALPIASILWVPAEAAAFRTMQPAAAAHDVILVQSEEGLSEEELRKLRRKQRQQEQQAQEEQNAAEERQKSERQKAREERRKQQQEQQAQDEQNRAAEEQQKSERQKAREERRKQQQEQQAQDEQNRAAEEQQKSERQKAREERRKQQQEQQAQDEQNRAAEEQQKSERQKARDERRKKQQEQQAQDEQNRAAEQQEAGEQAPSVEEEQQKSERQKAREERRKQREQQAQDEQNRAAEQQEAGEAPSVEEEQQGERQKAREERRKQREQQALEEQGRDAEQQAGEPAPSAGEEQQSERQKAREERRKKAQAERERRAAEENSQRPRRERDPERERIARDPSKTTDTIDLPVVGGAAVLDSDKEADNRGEGSREERRKRRAEERRQAERENAAIQVPTSDADAQRGRDGERRRPVRYEPIDRERGERFDRMPEYRNPDNARVYRREDNRVIYNIDNRTIVRHYDGERISRRAEVTYYENLRGGRVRETIERPGGVRVVTIRNRYGDIIQRSRFVGDREYVLYYIPEDDYGQIRDPYRDPGLYLPPMRLTIPVNEYIIDTSSNYDRDYVSFLEQPPVEPVERVYTLDEVKHSARIRDKVRRIDLDTITFATGSAEISMEQASTLRRVADAINELLDEDPSETFLIEGHTDAVGSDESNLILSDERAESVAYLLTDVYDIPPENLSTQGYGERYLKVATDGPEQLNRRVTIRRVTPLVKPVASAQ